MFCPANCKYLSETEQQQDARWYEGIRGKRSHICNKFKDRVFHGVYHPKLIRLKRCRMEEDHAIKA
jgi:hypothetical protein